MNGGGFKVQSGSPEQGIGALGHVTNDQMNEYTHASECFKVQSGFREQGAQGNQTSGQMHECSKVQTIKTNQMNECFQAQVQSGLLERGVGDQGQ